ncbi:MAG: class I SAM-dependent methyltransferase [Neisseria sp.]|nr:class I SAM-dependent methyltransferase [Neisseria sp.]
MSEEYCLLQPLAAAYLNRLPEAEHPVLQAIHRRSAQHRLGSMAAARATVDVLVWLARLMPVRHYLEIGVFTGYSSTAMALALPEDGTITACDINLTHTAHARTAWQEAGVAHKIDLYVQPALITLQELLAAGKGDFFDMALIDADKLPTMHYVEGCLKLVRSGGVMAVDNVLLGGRVADEQCDSPSLSTMRDINRALSRDSRFHALTLPLGDGVTLLIKK